MFRQAHWLHGGQRDACWDLPNVSWLNESGQIMTSEQWGDEFRQVLIMQLIDQKTSKNSGSGVLVMINNSEKKLTMPLNSDVIPSGQWECWLYTADPDHHALVLDDNHSIELPSKAVLVLRCYTPA